MVQLNVIVGSLGLFVLGASAGPCRPTDATTTLVISETATTTTALTTATATETTALATTTSAAPEEPACSIESPQFGFSNEYEVYCDSFAGSTTPIGSIYFANTLVECLDHCDDSPGCVGVNYITTVDRPYCTIWSNAGSFGQQKGVVLAKRVV
ncbi:hypothetical protein FLONG3_7928 [Fusarium longipes]|uniref:Apple domain-containing protein n=1 Tax=Fusarium longipes TaxID=694270 RepID=A0A395SA29_9HYPO|nr:hypothetical protein FLONG3_7928 [Fusarium longipes]